MIRKELPVKVIPPFPNEPKLHSNQLLKCPRCNSAKTKFRYYNNNCKNQPRYVCLDCKRYWTEGGTVRNASVGEDHKEKRPLFVPTLPSEQSEKAQKKNKLLSSPSVLEHPSKPEPLPFLDNISISTLQAEYQASRHPWEQHVKAQTVEAPLAPSSSSAFDLTGNVFSENLHVIRPHDNHRDSQAASELPAKDENKTVTLLSSSSLEIPLKAEPLSFSENLHTSASQVKLQISQKPLEQPLKAQEKEKFISLSSSLEHSAKFAPVSFLENIHLGASHSRHQFSQPPLEQFAIVALSKGLSTSVSHQDKHLASISQDPNEMLKCTHCNSSDTKLCYNHIKNQPQHLCRRCKKQWIASRTFRNCNVDGCVIKDESQKMSTVSCSLLEESGNQNEMQSLSLSLSLSPLLEQCGGQNGGNTLVSFAPFLEEAGDQKDKNKPESVYSQKHRPSSLKQNKSQDESLSLSLALSSSLDHNESRNNEDALVPCSPVSQQGEDQSKTGSVSYLPSLECSRKFRPSLDMCHDKCLVSSSSGPNEASGSSGLNEKINCPRCSSSDTKFRYYNNNRKAQPRYICRNCKRCFTAGGAIRNAYVSGSMKGSKSHKKARLEPLPSLQLASNSMVLANLSNRPTQLPAS